MPPARIDVQSSARWTPSLIKLTLLPPMTTSQFEAVFASVTKSLGLGISTTAQVPQQGRGTRTSKMPALSDGVTNRWALRSMRTLLDTCHAERKLTEFIVQAFCDDSSSMDSFDSLTEQLHIPTIKAQTSRISTPTMARIFVGSST